MKTILLTENEYRKVQHILNESVRELPTLITKMRKEFSSYDTFRPFLMSVNYNAEENRFEATNAYIMLVIDASKFGVHSTQDVKDRLDENKFGMIENNNGGVCIFTLNTKRDINAFETLEKKGEKIKYPNTNTVIPPKWSMVNVKENEDKEAYPVHRTDGDWMLSYCTYVRKDTIEEMNKYMKWFTRDSFEDTMMFNPDKPNGPLVSYQDDFTMLCMPNHT